VTVTHDWIRARYAAWLAGTLSDPDRRAFEDHIAQCVACRSEVDALLGYHELDTAEDAHLPTTLLASWEKRAPRLRGGMRLLVQQHLERCESCCRELESVGANPNLIWVPEVHGLPQRADKSTAKGHGREAIRRLLTGGRTQVAALLAAAASLVIVIQLGLFASRKPGDVPGVIPGSQVTKRTVGSEHPAPPSPVEPPSTTRTQAPLLALAPETSASVRLRETFRGETSSGSVPTVSFDGGRQVSFVLPQSLGLAEGDRVEIAFLGFGDEVLATLPTTMADLFPAGSRKSIVLTQGVPAFASGHYRLRIRVWNSANHISEESTYFFTVR